MNRTALLLIDFINEIVDDKGKLAGKGYASFVKEHSTLENVQVAIGKAHKNGVLVVFVTVEFKPDYSDWPENSTLFGAAKKFEALKGETWATELHDSIDLSQVDHRFKKNRISAFYKTPLQDFLDKENVETLFIGGVATDIAVESAVRDAHDRDFKVIVLEDLCAAASQEDHESALKHLAKMAQISDSSTAPELN